MTEFTKTEKSVEHPLEEILEIEAGTTVTEYTEALPVQAVKPENYDDKDKEIEGQLQEIYESAMAQFETQSEEARQVEGKYKARNGEVAIQALNTALHATRTKAEIKVNKDKLEVKKITAGGPRTLNQNLVVADRNELLKILEDNEE